METLGYTTIPIGHPPQSDVDEVQRVFEESRKYTASGIVFCEGGNECRRFLRTDNEEAGVRHRVPVR